MFSQLSHFLNHETLVLNKGYSFLTFPTYILRNKYDPVLMVFSQRTILASFLLPSAFYKAVIMSNFYL